MPVSNPGGVVDEALGTYLDLAELLEAHPTAGQGDFAVVASDGHTYVWVDPSGWTDTGTAYFTPGPEGPEGPQGDPGVRVAEASVGVSSPSSLLVASVAAGQSILSVTVAVEAAWDGYGASLTVGTAAEPTLMMSAADIDLSSACEFTKDHEFEGPCDVYVHLAPGAGAASGSASVRVEIANKG